MDPKIKTECKMHGIDPLKLLNKTSENEKFCPRSKFHLTCMPINGYYGNFK